MKRESGYVAEPRSWWEYVPDGRPSPHTSIDVLVREQGPHKTGLLDAEGRELVWYPPHRPVGFHTKWRD